MRKEPGWIGVGAEAAAEHAGDAGAREPPPREREEVGEPLAGRVRRRTRSARPGRRREKHRARRCPLRTHAGRCPGRGTPAGRAGGQRIARTVFSTTPPARPRHPACATATVVPACRSAIPARSRQRESRTRFRRSARRRRRLRAPRSRHVGVDHAAAVHLLQPHRLAPAGARAGRARFAATAAGSSAVRRPRLKLAYGPLLAPPARVVTNARTLEGAGQSGTIQSGWSVVQRRDW